MDWKKYLVQAQGAVRGGECVIEAPGPGVAVEYYLAIHGMLHYDQMRCEPVADWSQSARIEFNADVLHLMPNAEALEPELARFHHPTQEAP